MSTIWSRFRLSKDSKKTFGFPPIAETTMAIRLFASSGFMISMHFRIQSALPTLVPPNLCTSHRQDVLLAYSDIRVCMKKVRWPNFPYETLEIIKYCIYLWTVRAWKYFFPFSSDVFLLLSSCVFHTLTHTELTSHYVSSSSNSTWWWSALFLVLRI